MARMRARAPGASASSASSARAMRGRRGHRTVGAAHRHMRSRSMTRAGLESHVRGSVSEKLKRRAWAQIHAEQRLDGKR